MRLTPRQPTPARRRHWALLIHVAVLAFAAAEPAYAQGTVLALAGSVDQVLDNIRNWLMSILAALATVFLTVGGVRRVMGGEILASRRKPRPASKAPPSATGWPRWRPWS